MDLAIRASEASAIVVHPERACRLIVLVTPETGCTSLTRRICKIAHETNSDILLLGLSRDSAQELALQRELITAAAMIRDAKIYVDMEIGIGTDWLAFVKCKYQEGDMIVCIADQSVGFRRKPLSQILESTFHAPIYLLTESKPKQVSSGALSQLFVWSGLIGILAVFFVLQTKIIGLPDNWLRTVLSVLILIPEILSILFWNSLF